jgi:nicotinamide-nucleotide amidase
LAGQVNTHQAWLSLKLRQAGFDVIGESSVPDDIPAISQALTRSLAQAEIVIVSGGLGPTFDDVTREATAKTLRRTLSLRPSLWKKILRRFSGSLAIIPEENKRQAMVIAGATVLDNPYGSAPVQLIHVGKKSIALLPGPPSEMYPMFNDSVLLLLSRRYTRGLYPVVFTARMSGIAESVADEKLDAVRARWPQAQFTILASGGEVSFHARIIEKTRAAADSWREKIRHEILTCVGPFVHGQADETLEYALGTRLSKYGLTLSVAESCTGGLLGGRITSVPGSSTWFKGGIQAYHNSVKRKLLHVPQKTIDQHGAVSQECALAMAQGARLALGTSMGLAITGIAGPEGGTKTKPVGLVFIACDGPKAKKTVRQLLIKGSRETVRARAVSAALRLAWEAVAP